MSRVLAAVCIVVSFGAADAEDLWPQLPLTDSDVMIPAQEWPCQPGPRQVRVYVRYPGGSIDNVSARTGLFLTLHNWGGTFDVGAPDPVVLANRYDCVAICVDYVQSGQNWKDAGPYDFGYFQALDALRAAWFVYAGLQKEGRAFDKGRIYATGGSGGGNVALMANKLAPRTFACVVELCGMAKLADDLAFGTPGRTTLNAGYSKDPADDCHLAPDAQALRFVGHPAHVQLMKTLGNSAKVVVVHGIADKSCPIEDAHEMAANMKAAGLDVEPIWVDKTMIDGRVFKTTGHALGDRTAIVEQVASSYLLPDGANAKTRLDKNDFECKDDEVRYETPGGWYVISYAAGYPVGLFVAKGGNK